MLVNSVLTKDATTRRPRVLVVEDDQSVSRMLRLSLSSAGFEITEMSTGGDALRVLDSAEVDAVVLDLGLPDDLGGKLLGRLQGGAASPSPTRAALMLTVPTSIPTNTLIRWARSFPNVVVVVDLLLSFQ